MKIFAILTSLFTMSAGFAQGRCTRSNSDLIINSYIFSEQRTLNLIEGTGKGCQLEGIKLCGNSRYYCYGYDYVQIELDRTSKGYYMKANLNHGIFKKVVFKGDDFTDATFRWAKLKKADFRDAILTRVDFAHANLRRADFRGAILEGTDFIEAKLKKAKFQGVEGAVFVETDFSMANLNGADFEGTNLGLVNFTGAKLGGANFKNADLSSADFSDANFRISPFDFDTIFLGRANLDGAKLNGAKYNSNTKFPLFFNPDNEGMVLVEDE